MLLLYCCSEVVKGCFPECSLLLVLLEDASLESELTERYVVQAAKQAAQLPEHQLLVLRDLPSVEMACRTQRKLFKCATDMTPTG